MSYVAVSVPATIANLGPGFDCMGLAVAWRNRVTVGRSLDPSATEPSIEITGPGSDRIPRDERNLVMQTLRACERAAGAEPAAWSVLIENVTPYGRGLGSSACAIVAGAVAALHSGLAIDPLTIAGEVEGHLDNVSAALLGGITISGFAPDKALRIEPPDGLTVLACIAPGRLSTKQARAALPEAVPFSDAVFTAGRAAVLAGSLAAGDLSYLMEATEDRLHQQARFGIAPDAATVCAALRDAGFAAFLSGAGPSVSALVRTEDAERAAEVARAAASAGSGEWQVLPLAIDPRGAVVE